MFAYCLSSPTNGSDPCGACFHHLKFWEDCEKCKANNSTEKFFENVTESAKSFVKNLEFSAGIGQGIYAEFEVFEVGISIGMYGNYGTINYSEGEWYTGQELYSGVTASITPWLEFGAAEHFSRDNERNETCVRWFGLNDTQETWTIFSIACYPIFAGGSINVGFDVVTFLEEWDAIWEE